MTLDFSMNTSWNDAHTLTFHTYEPQYVTFGGGVSINLSNGQVIIPEHLTIDEASKQFYDCLKVHFGAK